MRIRASKDFNVHHCGALKAFQGNGYLTIQCLAAFGYSCSCLDWFSDIGDEDHCKVPLGTILELCTRYCELLC